MKKLLSFALFLPLCWACNFGAPTETPASLTQKLIDIDKAMGGANVTDQAKAAEFVKTSEQLAAMVEKTNPDQYVDVLLKAGGLAITIKDYPKAIELYKRVSEGLPQHPKAPTALFLQAFVYDNNMADLENAKKTYEEFLQKYPNDPDFADDAKIMLERLGTPAEEIIKGFDKGETEQ